MSFRRTRRCPKAIALVNFGARSMSPGSIARLAGVAILAGTLAQAALAADDVILDPRDYPIRAGVFSKLAQFQDRLHLRHADCRKGKPPATDRDEPGTLGPRTAAEIVALAACDKTIAPAARPQRTASSRQPYGAPSWDASRHPPSGS